MSTPTKTASRFSLRRLEVVRVTDITPHMRRITLGGEAMVGFPEECNGFNIKMFFPRPGQNEPMLPTITSEGPIWPPAEERPFTRTYTVRRYTPAAGELDIDFVLHGDEGPASRWALNAEPGTVIGIGGPRVEGSVIPDADWYLLVGDETALPAISAILELLPSTAQGEAFIEVADASEEQVIEFEAQIKLTWLHRNGIRQGQSTFLETAVRQIDLPNEGVYVWVTAESVAVKAIRNYLRKERGLARQDVYAVPYWRAGLSEEAYHDERHRVMDDEE